MQRNPWPSTIQCNTYLLLVECEVRTASYGPSFFFLPFMAQAQSTRAMKTRKERGSIICRTDRGNEAYKMFIYGLVDYSGFEKVIRLLTDLKLTNHSARNQSAI